MPSTIKLRPVIESDLDTLYVQQCDPVANLMAAFAAREREPFMAHWAAIMRSEQTVLRTILCDDEIAGHIVSWPQAGEREVGYWIGRSYWGRGVASAALAAFLKVESSRPLHAHTALHNIASQRVLVKCGFERSGEERYDDPGGPVDMLVFTLRAADPN